ncbi:MAG: LbtU family siderophore porin [Desulfobacterales bacterium]|nr:LbtU family siderophore porin [Desulfobacterales bacterium]
MSKLNIKLAIALVLSLGVINMPAAFAASNVELEERIEALEKEKTSSANIWDRFSLSGAIELDYTSAETQDPADKTNDASTSDLDVGTLELGIEATPHEYVTAFALLKGENLASDDNVFWDEAYFTLAKEGLPVYFTGGKRAQPFGLFESLFINDPITQDLYEINDTGATVGFTSESWMNMDPSFTIYKGETLIDRVNETGYGWTRDTSAGYEATKTVGSYIVNATFEPVEGLTIAAFLNSEPGDSDRNTTLGGALHYEYAGFILDFEAMKALSREKNTTDNKEYEESAWVASLGYQITDPLVFAVRYEDFDADNDNDGNLDNRYSIGADYLLLENDHFACNLMGEFRRSEYTGDDASANDLDMNELFARIAVSF